MQDFISTADIASSYACRTIASPMRRLRSSSRGASFLEKSASMQLLEINGQNARKFSVPEATMRKILLSDQQHQQQHAGSILRRVHLHRVLIAAGSSNDFPFSLGVRVHGVPCTVFDEQGQDWTHFAPAAHPRQRLCCI